jgi:hypothetical protein
VQRLPTSINALVTDPVWPKALPSLRGSEDPCGLLTETLRLAAGHHQIEQIILQFRCDSDPRILGAVPGHYPFVRLAWLPVSVATPTGRILMSGDVGYLFGTPPVSRASNRSLPGEIQKLYTPLYDYADMGASPKAQPFKGTTKHPCPRSLEHVEWLVSLLTLNKPHFETICQNRIYSFYNALSGIRGMNSILTAFNEMPDTRLRYTLA